MALTHSVFLPVRAGSQRVPRKNIRPFAGIDGGLVELKLRQLSKLPDNYEIILSTDDSTAMAIGRKSDFADRVIVDRRPDVLCTSTVPLLDLIKYVPQVCTTENIIWTHVTSPFLDAPRILSACEAFLKAESDGHDSLMSVTRIQKYIWDATTCAAVNYNHGECPWPSTQKLPLWYEVNSALFIAKRGTYELNQDRIGERPFLWENDWLSSVDVDWEKDFVLAETIYRRLYDEVN